MSVPVDRDDLATLLARAFVRAWERYYVADRGDAIAEEVARPALAHHLVAMAKDGVEQELILAEAGLKHLISLTPKPQASGPEQGQIIERQSPIPTLRIDRPQARFLPEWRIPFAL